MASCLNEEIVDFILLLDVGHLEILAFLRLRLMLSLLAMGLLLGLDHFSAPVGVGFALLAGHRSTLMVSLA